MRSVHPVFHVSMLEPATSNTFSKRIQLAPAPVIIDGEPEYEISRIVDSKIDCRWACKLLYKVIWLWYEDTGDESEWIPTSYIYIPPSLVLSYCPKHAVAFVLCLRAFLIGIFLYLISLVYSVCLFSLTLSFCTPFKVSSQNFQTSFHLILTFLTHTFNSQEINKKILLKEKTKPVY